MSTKLSEGVTQEEAFERLLSTPYTCLTGPAGSGKTHTIHKLVKAVKDNGGDGLIALTASTGIAAKNIGGTTLNYFMGYGLGRQKLDGKPEDTLKFIQRCAYSPHFNRDGIQKIHCLIVDEVSMLHYNVIDDLDLLFRYFRGSDDPFGGCQVIFSGDFYQLPPVSQAPRMPWAFKANVWEKAPVEKIQLHKIYRQTDERWIRILNNMRIGVIDEAAESLLYNRSEDDYPDPKTYEGTVLMSHNDKVEHYNQMALAQVKGSARTFWGISAGKEAELKELKDGMVTPDKLELKIGARVIMTVNKVCGDEGASFVNGTFGTITEFGSDCIYVELETGEEVPIKRHTWDNEHVNGGTATASFRQFPMRLAYAMSIHRSQGQTLSKIFIDAAKIFCAGQFYVAMSRCRTLEGISLRGYNSGKCWADFDALNYYK